MRPLKDVPKETFENAEVDFRGPLSSRTGHATRHLLAHGRGLDNARLDHTLASAADVEDVATSSGARVDLWDVILVHSDVWTALALLIMGLLRWWTAPCIVMTASKVRHDAIPILERQG